MNRRNRRTNWTRTTAIFAPLLVVAVLFSGVCAGCKDRREQRRRAREEALSTLAERFGVRRDEASSTRPEGPPSTIGLTAATALADMAAAYANAKYYSDAARVEIVCERSASESAGNGSRERFSIRVPCAFSFAKPNFARAEIGRGVFCSDGETIRARLDDAARFGRRLEYPAPMVLTSIKELYPDVELAKAMDLGVPKNLFWAPPQAILLLAKDPLRTLAPEGAQTTLLAPEYWRPDDAAPDSDAASATVCDRVQVADDDGVRVFWIDRRTKTLARLELPIERVAVAENVDRVAALRIEFLNRVLSDASPRDLSIFRLAPSSNERVVERFLPPELLALGQKFPNAPLRSLVSGFSDLRLGANDASDETSNKATLLCFWGSSTPNDPGLGERSATALKEFERTAQYNANDSRLDFLAVNFDPPDVSDESARLEYGAKGATTPLYRLDRTAFDDANFPAPALPSFALVDARGVVRQYCSAPVSFVRLQRRVARAQASDGDAAFDDEFNAYYADVKRFADELDAADAGDSYRLETDDSDSRPAIAPPRQYPKTFGLREVWQFDGLYAPSNPLPVSGAAASAPSESSDAESSESTVESTASETGVVPLASQTLPKNLLVVPCDGNALAILSEKGRLLRKTTPVAAIGEPISFVRTVEYGAGKRFYVASARLQSRKVHRFDENFNDLGTLDVGRLDGRRVGDAQFVDVDADGTPELALGLVGDSAANAASTSGLFAVDMKTPKIRWKDESVVEPYRLGVRTRPDETPTRRLLATNRSEGVVGTIVEDDAATGERLAELRAGDVGSTDSFLSLAVSDATASGESNVVALLARAEPNATFFVGLGTDGSILWKNRIDLSNDEGGQMERVVPGDLDGDGVDEWLVATSDGVVRFFAADGKPLDVFQFGEEISGARVARWSGESFLIVADLKKVSAWKIEKRR